MFANVSTYFYVQASTSSFETPSAEVQWENINDGSERVVACASNQGATEHWDVERQMMLYSTPGSIVPTSAPIEIGGTTYYTPAPESRTSGYETFEGSLSSSVGSFEENPWTQESIQNDEKWQRTTFYAVPNRSTVESIQVAGTTYFYPPSGSSVSFTSMESYDECGWTEEPLPIINKITTLQKTLENLLLTEDQLKAAGFPIVDENGQISIEPTQWERNTRTWIVEDELTRKCSRCYKDFLVDAKGSFPTGKGICQYKVSGLWKIADNHITIQRFTSELTKFVETSAPAGKEDNRGSKVFALDAEMIITTAGPALARLSVVDFDGQLVLDKIVKPEAEVVDCLTEFSGITMKMLESAPSSLEDCRRLLLELINSNSVLIGHGLESDLKALRLVHRKVIDTSIIYQQAGRKVALRKLAQEHLGRCIQTDNSSKFGHCSEEDALASLDLVKHRINIC